MVSVSIIIPLHNKGPFIASTLASVRCQTFSNWEAIVVENHSNDRGPSLVETLALKDNRIRLIRAPDSVRGPSAARNIGLCESSGEWILFLDADDLLKKRYLELMLQSQLNLCHTNVIASPWIEFIDGCDPSQGDIKYPAGYHSNSVGVEVTSIAFTSWAIHSALVRRSWLCDKPWPENLDNFLAEDTAFWFRVVQDAQVVYSDYPGALYRTQTKNCRTNPSPSAWFEGTHRAVLANLEYLNSRNKDPSLAQIETLVRFYEHLYEVATCHKDHKIAQKALRFAEFWLSKLEFPPKTRHAMMFLRQLVGLPAFCWIKKLKSLLKSAKSS